MKKNKAKPFKLPPQVLYTVLVLLGYGAGYTSHEFVPQQPSSRYQNQREEGALQQANGSNITVCFTPNKQCQLRLIEQIGKARESIYVQAYSFTDRAVTDALVKAAKRGVKVSILLDKSNKNDRRSAKDLILDNQIPIRFDYPSGIAHNKVMIIDQSTILTGSYNFSESAFKRNTENLLIIQSQPLAQQYIQNWLERWNVSR